MAVMEGSLSKWTNVMKGWQYRWFVLDENSGLLSYYTSKEKMMRGVRRGCVRLKGAVIGIDDEDDSTFTITVDHKTFHFQARDAEEREKWVRALEETIFRHQNYRTRYDINRPPPTMKDFDNKVSEADAYLQLMIDQTKKLEEKIETMSDSEEKAKCQLILQHANTMLDNIKHSIVLLQIAKNTAHPINGIYQQRTSISTTFPSNTGDNATALGESVVQQGVELGSECIENARRRSTITSAPSLSVPVLSYSSSEEEEDFFDANDSPFAALSQLPTPTDDDEINLESVQFEEEQQRAVNSRCFSQSQIFMFLYTLVWITLVVFGFVYVFYYEMVDYFLRQDHHPLVQPDATLTGSPRTFSIDDQLLSTQDAISSAKVSTGTQLSAVPSPASVPLSVPSSQSTLISDYDALYEDEDETDVQIESQGSVIKHLLGQVKIGMDLTKVVLPTFILERRSLLEMYADYFAHPDIFVGIADLKDPKERMIQVVKWYLSSYHAGRKSSVAKKPYNPILGEVFYCFWDMPNESECEESAPDGPIPWCKKNQLTFVAEQVSHHPPISAFYAEHYNKRISFNAHIYTKSKFLGLSICVHNIGQGVVSVLDYNEEYAVTFPNGYGRSILTVPWIELGGTVNISCQKTGYHCNIEFITKPFYGNKKHRVLGEVYGPEDPKKPFLVINGEWNGLMEAKWNDGDMEEFINVNKLSIVRKKVRPITQQAENESRKLWKEVTAGLKVNNIDVATNAKAALEQKQRDEAKYRKEYNIAWETKLFNKFQDDGWHYIKPLQQRLTEASNT